MPDTLVFPGLADHTVIGVMNLDEPVDSPRAQYFPEHATPLGPVTLGQAGVHTLNIRATRIVPEADEGLTLSAVELMRLQARPGGHEEAWPSNSLRRATSL